MSDYNKCPRCGGEIYKLRDSMSGTVYLTYSCMSCDWLEEENAGTAMWKVLHDHNEPPVSEPEALLPPVSEPQAASPRVPEPLALTPTASTPEPKPRWRWFWPYVVSVLIALAIRHYFWGGLRSPFD